MALRNRQVLHVAFNPAMATKSLLAVAAGAEVRIHCALDADADDVRDLLSSGALSQWTV